MLSNHNRVQLCHWTKCDGHSFGRFFVTSMSNSFSTSSGIVSYALETFDGIFTISTTYLPKKMSFLGGGLNYFLFPSPFGEDFFQFDDYFLEKCFKSLDFQWLRHQERKKSSDEAASMTPKEIFRSADLCGGTSCCLLLWDEIVGCFFKQRISDFLFKCMFISILIQYCTPKNLRKRVFKDWKSTLPYSHWTDQNRVRSGFIATSFRPCYLH